MHSCKGLQNISYYQNFLLWQKSFSLYLTPVKVLKFYFEQAELLNLILVRKIIDYFIRSILIC